LVEGGETIDPRGDRKKSQYSKKNRDRVVRPGSPPALTQPARIRRGTSVLREKRGDPAYEGRVGVETSKVGDRKTRKWVCCGRSRTGAKIQRLLLTHGRTEPCAGKPNLKASKNERNAVTLKTTTGKPGGNQPPKGRHARPKNNRDL